MLTIVALSLSISPVKDVRLEVIDLADRFYQSRFIDKELTSKGVFGVNRVVSSKIEAHGMETADPAYGRRDVGSSVYIYGNKGKSLNSRLIVMRYHRLMNPTKDGEVKPGDTRGIIRIVQPPKDAIDILVREAAKKSIAGNPGPFTKDSNGWLLQVRRVNLSKSECLPCHKGQKLGDPIALIAYMARKSS